jgi:transcriptional regulator with XRE-family HTH domain
MTERFKILLDQLKLSPSEFAERIGVQRSSISHILSGRNKPSLDFMEKILAVFPDTDVYWLITGKTSRKIEAPAPVISFESDKIVSIPDDQDVNRKSEPPALDKTEPVEQVIIVYKDKTFRILNPSEK